MVSATNELLQFSSQELADKIDPLGLEPIPDDTRQRFLRFQLEGENRMLLPLQDILEVRQLATIEILPIPDVSDFMLGVCNWRGKILWLADLNALVGNSPLWHQAPLLEQPVAIVVQSTQKTVGLIVRQVDDVELIEPDSIQQRANLHSPELASYTVGDLPDFRGTVLNAIAIVEHLL
ncbi:MAG: chemotaxis protein CheW [Cyanobacteria bacterium P01_H01_bin.105]